MSSNYGNKERMIAAALARFPLVKKASKAVYQRVQYQLHRKDYSFHSSYPLHEVDHLGKETFFGYYDQSPLNESGNYLIFQASNVPTRMKPDPEKPVEVILSNWNTREVKSAFSSHAYNWQQGTKLQWLDNERFIFNDYDKNEDRYVSKIVDALEGKIVKTLSNPVYDCHKNFALGLNFDRLMLLRPDYGYFNRKNKVSRSTLNDRKDGIYYIDLEKDRQELIISLHELKNFKSRPGFERAYHKVNHILLCPDGKRFIFLHRWLQRGIKTDRLILFDLESKDLILLAEGMLSHFAWVDDELLIGYMAPEGSQAAYYTLDLSRQETLPVKVQMLDSLGDGHPNIFANQALMDTYPNKSRMKELFHYDTCNSRLHKIAEFYEGFRFGGETRCDLHPRWDQQGKWIFVDSVHSGLRKLYALRYD